LPYAFQHTSFHCEFELAATEVLPDLRTGRHAALSLEEGRKVVFHDPDAAARVG
jgi:hypothetical protein